MRKGGIKQPPLGTLPALHLILLSLTSFTFTLDRDPGTTRQKEGDLNATLHATRLLRKLFTISRVACIGRAIQETVKGDFFLGKSAFCCH